MKKTTAAKLDADINEALATRQARSDFHRGNLPSWMWEDLESRLATGDVVLRKVDRATRVTGDGAATYYYNGENFDEDPSVPRGYYGRWKARGRSADSLKSLLAEIDAKHQQGGPRHASKKKFPLTRGYFKIGDIVLMGKYKNKRGVIIDFAEDQWGNPTVEIEPIPKGRKQNKVVGLYKIWRADVKEGITGVPQKYQPPKHKPRRHPA